MREHEDITVTCKIIHEFYVFVKNQRKQITMSRVTNRLYGLFMEGRNRCSGQSAQGSAGIPQKIQLNRTKIRDILIGIKSSGTAVREAVMILMVCVDDRGGMLFHHRRQSQDRVVREDLLREAGDRLLMNAYSAKQFEPDAHIICAEDCLERAGEGDCCFVENLDPLAYADRIEKVIVYHWNRVYPADVYFTIPLQDAPWKLESVTEFPGFSHEKITKEVYIHENI